MKNILKYLTVLSLLITLGSCEDIVDNVDLPDVEPKLVVFSYISPGVDTVFAQVARSRKLNESINSFDLIINNATVTVSQMGGNSIQLQFNPDAEYYFAPVQPGFFETGKQYRINADTPDGKQVDATCSLPVQNTTLRLTRVDSLIVQDRMRYRFRLEFDDIPGLPDFYRIIPKAISKFEWDGQVQYYEYTAGFLYGSEFISVGNRDGETIVAEAYVDMWRDYYFTEQLTAMKFYLLSTDEHYYNFHSSLQRYVPDNPFSEPTVVYSNINNGLGVFAGFNSFLIEYSLENQDGQE